MKIQSEKIFQKIYKAKGKWKRDNYNKYVEVLISWKEYWLEKKTNIIEKTDKGLKTMIHK